MVESGGEPGGLSKIAAQFDHGHAAVDGCNLAEQGEGAVERAVVDQHHLESFAASLHYGLQASIQVSNVFLLIVKRNYDGIFEHSILYYTAAQGRFRSDSGETGRLFEFEAPLKVTSRDTMVAPAGIEPA